MRELQTLLESMIDDAEMTVEKASAKAKTGLTLLLMYEKEMAKATNVVNAARSFRDMDEPNIDHAHHNITGKIKFTDAFEYFSNVLNDAIDEFDELKKKSP